MSGLAGLFFCSGALALIYEVIWQRQFALVFGSGAVAAAAVLAAYFAGLGAGSLVLGAAAARWARPLRAYAILEVLIGVGALLVSPMLAGFARFYPWLFDRFGDSPGAFFAVKTMLVFGSLAIPTFCMGGTLPVLGRLVDRDHRNLGRTAGLLYAVNTAGAAIGALSVPFLLLPALGGAGALRCCVAGSLLVAVGALVLDRSWQVDPRVRSLEASGSKGVAEPGARKESVGPVMALSAVSGAATFALQVLWNRAFAQVHENSAYSFAVIVSVFLLALALGAQLSRTGLSHGWAPERLIAWAWLSGGVLVAAMPWAFVALTDGLAYLPSEGSWNSYVMRLFGLAGAVLLLPVTLLGIALPALMERVGQKGAGSAGRLLGQVLAANLVGSVAGALIAGFMLPRVLGLWSGMLVVSGLLMVAGASQWHPRPGAAANSRFRLGVVAAFLGGLWALSQLNLERVRIAQAQGERLVAISEGAHGVTAVVERLGSRRLKLNNHYVLGGTSSTGDERMQLHIPMLLHGSPSRVAVLGVGTGITAGGALFHPFERITAVELVPEVIREARAHFMEANGGVLEDSRTVIVVDDARNYLRGTLERFEVIIGDLVVPWRQGEGALFTVEHFSAARRALAPGGLFCQWLPLFQLSEVELNILLRTFLTVFPRAYVWRGDFSPSEPAIALVSGVEPFSLDPSHVERRVRELRPDPSNSPLAEPMALWMHFVGVLETSDLAAGETRINREDRPWIELLGPKRHAEGGGLFNGRRLHAWLSQVRRRSIGRLANAGDVESTGSEAGEVLSEFTLLLSEGNEARGRDAQARLRTLLPQDVFKRVFPGEADVGR